MLGVLFFVISVIGAFVGGYYLGHKDVHDEAVFRGYGHYNDKTRQFYWGDSPLRKKAEELEKQLSNVREEYNHTNTNLISELEEIEDKYTELQREHRKCGKRK